MCNLSAHKQLFCEVLVSESIIVIPCVLLTDL